MVTLFSTIQVTKTFSNKLEVVQHNATLAITRAIQGTSRIKVCQELGLESLKSCRWFRCPCYFYEIKNYGLPCYLSKFILYDTHSYNTCFSDNIRTYCRTDTFKHSFFPMDCSGRGGNHTCMHVILKVHVCFFACL